MAVLSTSNLHSNDPSPNPPFSNSPSNAPVLAPTSITPSANDTTPAYVDFVVMPQPHTEDHLSIEEEPTRFQSIILANSVHSASAHVVKHDAIMTKQGNKIHELCLEIKTELARSNLNMVIVWPSTSRIDYLDDQGKPGYMDISETGDHTPNENRNLVGLMRQLAEIYKDSGFHISSFGVHERGDQNGHTSFTLATGRLPHMTFSPTDALAKLKTKQVSVQDQIKVRRKIHAAISFIKKLDAYYDQKIVAYTNQANDPIAQRSCEIYKVRKRELSDLKEGGSKRAALIWALSHSDIVESYRDLKAKIEAMPGPEVQNLKNSMLSMTPIAWRERDSKITPHELQDMIDIVLLDVNDVKDIQLERQAYARSLKTLQGVINREIESKSLPFDSPIELEKKKSSFAQLICKMATAVADKTTCESVHNHALFATLGIGLKIEDQNELRQSIQNFIRDLKDEDDSLSNNSTPQQIQAAFEAIDNPPQSNALGPINSSNLA